MSEPLMRVLADLPVATPDGARANRTRARCRARLTRQTSRPSAMANTHVRLWQPMIAALGVAYLIAAIVQAFVVLGS